MIYAREVLGGVLFLIIIIVLIVVGGRVLGPRKPEKLWRQH